VDCDLDINHKIDTRAPFPLGITSLCMIYGSSITYSLPSIAFPSILIVLFSLQFIRQCKAKVFLWRELCLYNLFDQYCNCLCRPRVNTLYKPYVSYCLQSKYFNVLFLHLFYYSVLFIIWNFVLFSHQLFPNAILIVTVSHIKRFRGRYKYHIFSIVCAGRFPANSFWQDKKYRLSQLEWENLKYFSLNFPFSPN